MSSRGKTYKEQLAKIDSLKKYTVSEAFNLAVSTSRVKFDESLDVCFNLGVNPKYADQMLRGSIVMPNGTGRVKRVLVFAKGEKALEAEKAKADFIGAEDLVEKILGGWLDFDSVIATPDMMKVISKLGKILGTRGLMPNPKVGTVTLDIEKTVKEIKSGKVEYRTEKNGIVHASIGKVSFGSEKLIENFKVLISELQRVKPASSKGVYFKNIVVSTTMGVGIKLDVNNAVDILK